MGTERLYEVLPFMRELKKDRREAIEQFFQDAPDWLLESFRVVELDKNVVFIRENQPVDTVHIIARGMFKITDYRVYGIAYDFMQFDGINAMGGHGADHGHGYLSGNTADDYTVYFDPDSGGCICQMASDGYPCTEAGSQDHGTVSV